MNISYGITVCNEIEEIKVLLPFLLNTIDEEDEVVVLFDNKNGTEEVLKYLKSFSQGLNYTLITSYGFDGNFAKWKNTLNHFSRGQWIFQLDADEIISEFLIKNIKDILTNNDHIDIFYLSRINIVEGITDEHIRKWGWRKDENNWINFPDKQGRLFKAGLYWAGIVHEQIVGWHQYGMLPDDSTFCIYHLKDIARQEKQNDLYSRIGIQ